MRTKEEVLEEINKINNVPDLDESGLIVRMITLVALDWVLGDIPISPSERMEKVVEEYEEEANGK